VNNQDVGNVTTLDLGPLSNDTTYYVTITPYNDNGSAIGCPETSFTTDLTPANDLCGDALSIACGDVVTGDTSFATDTDEISPFCGITFQPDNNSAGVWYSFLGTGDFVTLDLGNSGFDTRVVVYEGTCGALVCIDGDDDSGPGLTSELTFPSVAGTTYSIYVAGYGSSTGVFEMNITCSGPPELPCDDNAPTIACGETVNGNTNGAPLYDYSGEDTCGTFVGNYAGLWYQFVAEGGDYTASTCNNANYDTKIIVYSGECPFLTCVDGNDDGPGCAGFSSFLQFPTTAGTTYFIFVTGFLGNTGEFNLTLDRVDGCAVPPAIDPAGLADWGLSPNPSRGTVDLDLQNFLDTDVTIDVMDLTGKLLSTHRLEDIQNPKYRMELHSNLKNGLYLVRLSSDQHSSAKRLILNR
ncbi:MAG: T9SS type A sorting domain-containing protein, partial [Bacteroidia bacterium]|nr:T9SS type A sorting domain-containing protein [Bacteroidia bacterium]